MLALVAQEFPEKQELHRNMLGLLGNVAEVKELRPQLMTSQFISVFRWVLPQPPGYSEYSSECSRFVLLVLLFI